MATAIEYGLIAAIISVAAITGVSSLGSTGYHVATKAECSAVKVHESGSIDLSCPGYEQLTTRMYTVDEHLALAEALTPRPMLCDLYTDRHALCSLKP